MSHRLTEEGDQAWRVELALLAASDLALSIPKHIRVIFMRATAGFIAECVFTDHHEEKLTKMETTALVYCIRYNEPLAVIQDVVVLTPPEDGQDLAFNTRIGKLGSSPEDGRYRVETLWKKGKRSKDPGYASLTAVPMVCLGTIRGFLTDRGAMDLEATIYTRLVKAKLAIGARFPGDKPRDLKELFYYKMHWAPVKKIMIEEFVRYKAMWWKHVFGNLVATFMDALAHYRLKWRTERRPNYESVIASEKFQVELAEKIANEYVEHPSSKSPTITFTESQEVIDLEKDESSEGEETHISDEEELTQDPELYHDTEDENSPVNALALSQSSRIQVLSIDDSQPDAEPTIESDPTSEAVPNADSTELEMKYPVPESQTTPRSTSPREELLDEIKASTQKMLDDAKAEVKATIKASSETLMDSLRAEFKELRADIHTQHHQQPAPGPVSLQLQQPVPSQMQQYQEFLQFQQFQLIWRRQRATQPQPQSDEAQWLQQLQQLEWRQQRYNQQRFNNQQRFQQGGQPM
ncbi:hypothetical protein PHYSODRAFT_254595 [Phytophthora sojae]|uniref:Uncharacterized protein n=1 Tax=Phytophthora sojae (strain P6497) TaxID=1094619 RepID=G5A3T6_PHYSP|nr:hypothetical protein PHYSODRAFT_254595 [Phytophthora sojae]EGZ09436.1 hypothetical protein PHYSODRAFT_254595 [Phytophthora sojae]|eukprot:XP_009534297.1 hypothetical protein PHYSODRAFT_254595 [Phytophthora sojae]